MRSFLLTGVVLLGSEKEEEFGGWMMEGVVGRETD